MIESRFKLQHVSHLTPAQAGVLIDFMERQKGGAERSIEMPGGKQVLMVTREQLWKIDQLGKELNWDSNPKRMRGFCKKYAGTDDPKFMTKEQAWRLIEGLKKVLKKDKKPAVKATESKMANNERKLVKE
jgi:hypothetical protein